MEREEKKMNDLDKIRADRKKVERLQARIADIEKTITAAKQSVKEVTVKSSRTNRQEEQLVKLIDLKSEHSALVLDLQLRIEHTYGMMEKELSEREYEIVDLYIQGLSMIEIAEKLRYSLSGVRKAMTRATEKIG